MSTEPYTPTTPIELLALEMARVDREPAAWQWFIPDAREMIAGLETNDE